MKCPSAALLTLCEGNPPVTGGFPSQRASNAESVSMSWSPHGYEAEILQKPFLYYWGSVWRYHQSCGFPTQRSYYTESHISLQKSGEFISKKNPHLPIVGELWNVYCEYFWKNRPWFARRELQIISLMAQQGCLSTCQIHPVIALSLCSY